MANHCGGSAATRQTIATLGLGELPLRYETLAPNNADRQTLFVSYAEPGSVAADKLEQQADVAAGSRLR